LGEENPVRHDLEAIRAGVAVRLGDQVVSVISSERDCGECRGIGFIQRDGWRYATVVSDADTADEIAGRLQMMIDQKRRAR
jgi:hypothetical protein